MWLKSIPDLLYMDISYSGYLDLQAGIRAKLVTYVIFGFWVPTITTHAITPWF
jgi:hypothetical protein